MSKLKKLGFGNKKNKPGTNGIVDAAGMSHKVTIYVGFCVDQVSLHVSLI